MSRVKIPITIKINELEYLESYLLDKIGKRFNPDFKIIHKDKDHDYMNIEIDLENGVAAYLLGCAEYSSPLNRFIYDMKNRNNDNTM
ncbi:hypothetical protein [Aquimarina algiphila]|uniref:hypothetical protein n=1 Tax=Aquimarina algiphila TaxID=2047982 RepID=UPI00233123B8|nr:hypothetical protein [Aquimarina algiphila]